MIPHRLEKLRQSLQEKELDALLVSQAENRRYLSGFHGSAGFLFISTEKALLAVDFRYVEQAKAQAPDFEVVRIEGELSRWFPEVVSTLGVRRLGFEALDLPFASYRTLTEAMSKMRNPLEWRPTEGVVEELRAIKDEAELGLILRAAALGDSALAEIDSWLVPGMTEREAAWRLEKYLREKGSESLPFDVIVAAGPNGALPHHRPSERPIRAGEPIVIDLGARVGGYSSDMTRTLYLGPPDDTFRQIYDLVLGAQLTAIATMEAGMTGQQADALARTVIELAGYGEAFGHGLGHGVGLATHEEPRLGQNSTSLLAEGMVVTVEPGLYLPGWGGVRIEDMVLLEKGKVRVLTKADKILA